MQNLLRSDVVLVFFLNSLMVLAGCTAPGSQVGPGRFSPDERQRIQAERLDFDIVVRDGPDCEVLRKTARSVSKEMDLSDIAKRMENTMNKAGGVGIAGPQVGLSLRIAVLMLDSDTDHPQTLFVCNPRIVERSDDTIDGYEGCLSVPDVGSLVRRNRWIRVEYETIDGKQVFAEAEGFNAVLWQHELDHLDGILYTDKRISELIPMEEVRRLRKQASDENESKATTFSENQSNNSSRLSLLFYV